MQQFKFAQLTTACDTFQTAPYPPRALPNRGMGVYPHLRWFRFAWLLLELRRIAFKRFNGSSYIFHGQSSKSRVAAQYVRRRRSFPLGALAPTDTHGRSPFLMVTYVTICLTCFRAIGLNVICLQCMDFKSYGTLVMFMQVDPFYAHCRWANGVQLLLHPMEHCIEEGASRLK